MTTHMEIRSIQERNFWTACKAKYQNAATSSCLKLDQQSGGLTMEEGPWTFG